MHTRIRYSCAVPPHGSEPGRHLPTDPLFGQLRSEHVAVLAHRLQLLERVLVLQTRLAGRRFKRLASPLQHLAFILRLHNLGFLP